MYLQVSFWFYTQPKKSRLHLVSSHSLNHPFQASPQCLLLPCHPHHKSSAQPSPMCPSVEPDHASAFPKVPHKLDPSSPHCKNPSPAYEKQRNAGTILCPPSAPYNPLPRPASPDHTAHSPESDKTPNWANTHSQAFPRAPYTHRQPALPCKIP